MSSDPLSATPGQRKLILSLLSSLLRCLRSELLDWICTLKARGWPLRQRRLVHIHHNKRVTKADERIEPSKSSSDAVAHKPRRSVRLPPLLARLLTSVNFNWRCGTLSIPLRLGLALLIAIRYRRLLTISVPTSFALLALLEISMVLYCPAPA